MVRVTVQYLTKKGSQNAPKHGKDPKEHARKLTHLYLNDQYIDSLGDIALCKNLKVLFLQNNQLSKIENLDFASQLTHLYLQRNKLTKIQGLNGLIRLQKLYLGYNSISVLEGLENLQCLLELHIEQQNLWPGEEIIFDPRTIAALGHTLKILNLQGNGLTSLDDLVGLDNLKTLMLASNNLSDVTKIQAFLSVVPSLAELDMRDNPVVQDYKNCNRILASSLHLRTFNEKQISVATLDFMKRFEEHQQKVITHRPRHTSKDLLNSISELAYNLPEALAKDVTSSIFMDVGLSNSTFGGSQTEIRPASELLVCASSDGGPFFHFPAFKSSTSLQYEGHTIPIPFHRQIKISGQLTQKNRPLKKPKAQWPSNIYSKNGTMNTKLQVAGNGDSTKVQSEMAGRTDGGDIVWKGKIILEAVPEPKREDAVQELDIVEVPVGVGHNTKQEVNE